MTIDNDFAFNAENLYGNNSEEMFQGALSFLRRPYRRDLAGVDLAIMGIPFDTATTNRPGARFGPRAMRAASTQLSWTTPYGWDFDPFKRLAVVDTGDCSFNLSQPAGVPDEIQAAAERVLDNDTALLCMGGDHFVTYPVLKAHAAKHGQLALIHFDAHCDTWPAEPGEINHGSMFYHAAKEGIIDPKHSVHVGVRTHNEDKLGFTWLDGQWVQEHSIAEVVAEIRATVGDLPVYLTFDIDCLDPAFAPGTGTPVCGGLTSAQAMGILRGLRGIDLVGMDVVEVAPAYDVGEVTSLAAATVAQQLICLYTESPTGVARRRSES